MRRVVILTSGLFLVIALAGSAREPKTEDGPAAQLSKAPRKAQLLQNPFVGQETAAAAGRKLYDDHCAQCHGSDGRGREHARRPELSGGIANRGNQEVHCRARPITINCGTPTMKAIPNHPIWC